MTGGYDRLRHALAVVSVLPALALLVSPVLAGRTSFAAVSVEARAIITVSIIVSVAIGFGPAKRRYDEWTSVEVDDEDW